MYIDIDECALHHNCDENAFCSNLDGSFTCTCNEGYYGNGHICIGQLQLMYKYYANSCYYKTLQI